MWKNLSVPAKWAARQQDIFNQCLPLADIAIDLAKEKVKSVIKNVYDYDEDIVVKEMKEQGLID